MKRFGIEVGNEVRKTDAATGGQKGMKPERISLIPWEGVRIIARASHYGATKYDDPKVGPHNWRRGYAWSLSYDALQRHLGAWWDGEDNDPESALSHLAHAGWHVLALLWFTVHKPTLDDRPHTYFATKACPGCGTTGVHYASCPEALKQDALSLLDEAVLLHDMTLVKRARQVLAGARAEWATDATGVRE